MRVVATAGHVDHGKTTLLRRLTGMEPDRWEEERRRGLTIDLGFVWTTLDGLDGPMTVAFVDVPGHQRFVPNMLAGAGSLTECLLVVAADDGWSAQTAEHVVILDLLGVRGVVTAITKSSVVSEERLAEVTAEVATRLAGSTLQDAPVMVVDSLTGDGVSQLARALATRLASLPGAPAAGARRLWIDRAFTIPGAGTVVTGTMQGGPLRVGQELRHSPSGRSMRVRGLHALGRPVDEAPVGTRVAVNLARVGVDEVGRGDALLADAWRTTSIIDVMLRSVARDPIGERGSWHLHIGSAQVPVRVRPLLDQVAPGERGPARLELHHPLPLRHGDRFVLRSVGTRTTAAGGFVLDPAPAPRARGMLARLELAEGLEALSDSTEASDLLVALLQLHAGHMPNEDVRATLDVPALDDTCDVVELGTVLVLEQALNNWERAALETVRASPADRGAPVMDVAAAVGRLGCPEPLRREVVDGLVRDQRLHAHGDILTDPATTLVYLDARAERQAAVLEAMSEDLLSPPGLDTTIRELHLVATELQDLFDDGRLVHAGGVVVTGAAVDLAHRLLRDRIHDRRFTASQAREVWGTTRKYAVPLLEHLAHVGITTFDGTHHRLAPTEVGRSTEARTGGETTSP